MHLPGPPSLWLAVAAGGCVLASAVITTAVVMDTVAPREPGTSPALPIPGGSQGSMLAAPAPNASRPAQAPAPRVSASGGPARTTPTAQAQHTAAPTPVSGLAQRLSTTSISLTADLPYLSHGDNNLPEWSRIDTSAAPDGSIRIAWPGADGVHVTPLSPSLQRAGQDVVVAGAQEVGGLVAHSGGFALLTRLPAPDQGQEPAAHLVRYRGDSQVFDRALTGPDTKDSAPSLGGQLQWNGSRYGAYFTVRGAHGPTAGRTGDKLTYVSPDGTLLDGGWPWGCSQSEGVALLPATSGPFPSLCGEDRRSGIFVSTAVGGPDDAPVISREECRNGYCGGTIGGFVQGSSRFAVAFTTRGAGASQTDPAGNGFVVTAESQTHQVAVRFLKDASTPTGTRVLVTDDHSTDHLNVRLAPYGPQRLLLSYETYEEARCSNGTCTGRFTGTHLRLLDYTGRLLTPDVTVPAHIAGAIARLRDGDLVWAYVAASPDRTTAMGTEPTARRLRIARLDYVGTS